MFNVDDKIIYGTHGVCSIIEISQKDFSGEKMDYYTLKPIHENKSIIFVPMENTALTSKMRSILSISEIYTIIRSMLDAEVVWIENDLERKERYSEILKNGNQKKLLQMINAIYSYKESQKANGKKLRSSDEQLFNKAEKMLYEEFAYVLNIECDQVLPFILDQIRDEKKTENSIQHIS